MSADAETLESLEVQAREEIARADGLPALQAVHARLLGRKGSVSGLLRAIGALDAAERARRGAAVTQLREIGRAHV